MNKTTRKVIIAMDGKLWTIGSLANFFNETEAYIRYNAIHKEEIYGKPVKYVGVATSHMYFAVKNKIGKEVMRGTVKDIAEKLFTTEQNVWSASNHTKVKRHKLMGEYTVEKLGSRLYYNGVEIDYQ